MLVVHKYGGTSVGTPTRIQQVADRIAERRARGDRIVVVVSAMGQTTDQLIHLARRITDRPSRREMDMLLTAGERISMALLSMALESRDVPAISFTGSQSGILTDSDHTRARIREVRPVRIVSELDRGRVVIVAGFQGVSREKEVTTLGRGGSDTTAVALAAGLRADRCEICTDVTGVMTADPRVVPTGRLLPSVSWDTMLELALHGAGVVHARAASLARNHEVPFQVCNPFRRNPGTMVEGFSIREAGTVVAVTGCPKAWRVHIEELPDGHGTVTAVVSALASSDLIDLRRESAPESTCVEALLSRWSPETEAAVNAASGEHGGRVSVEPGMATISIVGSGAMDIGAVGARAESALRAADITPRLQFGAGVSLTYVVAESECGPGQTVLHREFLETPGAPTSG